MDELEIQIKISLTCYGIGFIHYNLFRIISFKYDIIILGGKVYFNNFNFRFNDC